MEPGQLQNERAPALARRLRTIVVHVKRALQAAQIPAWARELGVASRKRRAAAVQKKPAMKRPAIADTSADEESVPSFVKCNRD